MRNHNVSKIHSKKTKNCSKKRSTKEKRVRTITNIVFT